MFISNLEGNLLKSLVSSEKAAHNGDEQPWPGVRVIQPAKTRKGLSGLGVAEEVSSRPPVATTQED
jgi:hypothetical protein